MEQDGLKPKDLDPVHRQQKQGFGSVERQRPLSLTMIRKLVTGLNLPAEVALRVTKTPPARARPKKRKSGECRPLKRSPKAGDP